MQLRLLPALALAIATGCSTRTLSVPGANLPRESLEFDTSTSRVMGVPKEPSKPMPPPPAGNKTFELPKNLPGAEAKPFVPPRFEANSTKEQRDAEIKKAFPELIPMTSQEPASGRSMNLSDFQQIATANSPAVRKAQGDAQASYGAAIQAGLHPNPTVGYEADQWQPGPTPQNNNGQQGGYINQLIKTAGKLKYAQRVAGFDYINALVAVRRAEVDLAAQVRQYYFAALSAKKGLEVNKALADLADEVYRIQLKQVAGGQAAGYEPLQLHAQAVQARNAVSLSEIAYQAAWTQLVAVTGLPDLAPAVLGGDADMQVPNFDLESAKTSVLAGHTDLLTVRNSIEQAKVHLHLQQITPIPDLQTNQVYQYDNAAQNFQFGLQLGISLPVFDRNQGGIRQARGQILSASENLRLTQINLVVKLAEAYARYRTNRTSVENFRDKVIPDLTQAYRIMIKRYQVEPDKVGFNDIVVAQQNLATALQTYLSALGSQWQAVVDVANITQQDELLFEKK